MKTVITEQINEKLTKLELQRLMDLYSDDLLFFIRGIVRNNEIAEELVSDVFVKLWSKRKYFSEIVNIKSYLFILARNESISFMRKNNRIKIVNLEELSDYHFTPLEENNGSDLFDQAMINQINEAIDSLPAKCKMAFSLAKVNGLKYKEVAEIMKISPLTVKNHVAYALEKICSKIGLSKKRKITHIFLFLFEAFIERKKIRLQFL